MQTQADDLTGQYTAEKQNGYPEVPDGFASFEQLTGEEQPKVPLVKKVFRFFSDVGQGALIESPKQVYGGVYDAGKAAGQAVESLLDFFNTPQVLQITNEKGEFDLDLVTRTEFEEKGGKRIADVMQPEKARTTTGNMIRSTAQFLTGFLPATKALKGVGGAGKLATLGRAAAAGAITDATVFDPHEKRLSNLIEQFPALSNPVSSYLSADPEDSEAEGRFKNAIEGLGLGVVTDGFIAAVKGIRSSAIAKAAEKKAAREAAQEQDLIEKFADIDEVKPDAELKTDTEIKAEAEAEPAFKMGDIKADEERALNINLEKLNTEQDVKDLISGVAEAYPDPINKARREVVTNERTKKLADQLGMTVDDLLNRRQGEAFTAEQALAARNILTASGENLVKLAKEATTGGEDAVLSFRRAMTQHYAIQSQVSGMTAEAGRALQSFKIPAVGGKERQQMIKDVLQSSGGIDSSKELAQMVSALDNAKALNKFVDGASKATTRDMLYEVWINGLLSNPTTHTVNAVGNSLTAFMGLGERKLASMIGRGVGEQTIKEGEVSAATWGMKEGAKEGMVLAFKTLKTGMPSDVLTKQEFSKYTSITGANLNLSGTPGRFADFLGSAVRTPGRMLMASDEFFKTVAYRMELHSQAFRQATGEGLQGDELSRRIADILENPPENIKLEAMDFSHYQTFTKPLGEGGQALQTAVNKLPGAKVIVPFIRTPANIMKYVGERSPLAVVGAVDLPVVGVIAPNIRADILAGGAKRDMALAKISMGSMIMAVSADMAMSKDITGSGPADPVLRKNLQATGWQPYSVKVGDKYYSYNRLDPVGALLGISADITQIIGQTEDVDTMAMCVAAAASVGKNITSKTYLRGVSEFFDAWNSVSEDPEDRNTKIVNWINRTGATAVPFSSALAGIERQIDPTMRDAQTLVERIQSRIPGWSESLPPVRNIFGEPVVLEGGVGLDIMSPVYVSTYKKDLVADEVARQKTRVRMPLKSIEGVRLDVEEYDQYVRFYSGENNKYVKNKPIKIALRELFSSTAYQSGTDGPDGVKSLMIKSVFEQYKKAAKQMMKENNHEVMNEIRKKRDEKRIKLGV